MVYFIYFFFISKIFSSDYGLNIETILSNSKMTVYSNMKPTKLFDYYGFNEFTCRLPPVLIESTSDNSRSFYISNNKPANYNPPVINIQNIKVKASNNAINPLIFGFTPSNYLYPGYPPIKFDIIYQCNSDNENNWSIVEIEILINQTTVKFSYQKVCRNEKIYNFDFSFIIILIVMIGLIAYQSRKPKILSTIKKFNGYNITINVNLAYITIASLLLICLFYQKEPFQIIFAILLGVIIFFSFGLVFNEFLTGIFFKFNISKILIQIPKIGSISIFFFIGNIISIPLLIYWGLTYNWIVTDILTIILIICFIKLIKFQSLKSALRFFILEIIFEIVWALLFSYGFDKSYDEFFSSDFNFPLKLECQTFSIFLQKKCTWISIINVLAHGLLLSYFYRFDCSKNFNIYYLFSLIGFIFGNIIWIIIQSFINFAIPEIIFTIPFMILFCIILSFKRNELVELWLGLFHDIELYDPLVKSSDINDKEFKKEESKDNYSNSSTLKEDSERNSILDKNSNFEKNTEKQLF